MSGQERREQLLDVGRTLFAEKGFEVVTVEEIVDVLDSRVTVTLPSWIVSAIAVVPGGAHPSYAHGYSERDNGFYVAWEEIARDRETFSTWADENILRRQSAGVS